jgi:hypothetical protein
MHWEDTPLRVSARVENLDGDEITQATITSIAVYSFDVDTGEQAGATVDLVVADVVFDTPRTPWTKDATGYNFRCTVPATCFPSGGDDYQDYRLEIIFTASDGSIIPVVRTVRAKNLRSS